MIASRTISRLSGNSAFRANTINRRLLSTEKEPLKEAVSDIKPIAKTWWTNVELWGRLGAIAGWGMSGSAIYDAQYQSPDIISMNMTTVLIVYSSLFARWAWIVKPQNLLLASCHITNVGAQLNQLRRALEYKLEQGQKEVVEKYLYTAAAGAAGGAACVMAGPAMRSKLMAANIGILSAAAAADAGECLIML